MSRSAFARRPRVASRSFVSIVCKALLPVSLAAHDLRARHSPRRRLSHSIPKPQTPPSAVLPGQVKHSGGSSPFVNLQPGSAWPPSRYDTSHHSCCLPARIRLTLGSQVHPLRISKNTPTSSPSKKMASGLPRPLSEISPSEKRRNSPSWHAGSPKVGRRLSSPQNGPSARHIACAPALVGPTKQR